MTPRPAANFELDQIKNDILCIIKWLMKKEDIDAILCRQVDQQQLNTKEYLFACACFMQLQYLISQLALGDDSILNIEKCLSYKFKDSSRQLLVKSLFSASLVAGWPEIDRGRLQDIFNSKVCWGMPITIGFLGSSIIASANNLPSKKTNQPIGADLWRRTHRPFVIVPGDEKKEKAKAELAKQHAAKAYAGYYEDQAVQRERAKIPVYYTSIAALSSSLEGQLKDYKYCDNFLGRFFKIKAANMKYANILKNRVKNVTKLPDDIRNLTYDDQLASLRKRADRLEEIFQNVVEVLESRSSKRLLNRVSTVKTLFHNELNEVGHERSSTCMNPIRKK